MIHPSAPLLPEEVIQRCRRLSVPLILDGVKAAGLELAGGGCMDAAILTWSWNRINPKTDTSAGIFPH